MNIGPMEIAIVLILALLVFGPKRLPQAGRSLGQAMRELRKATQAARSDLGIDQVAAEVKDLKTSIGLDDVAADVKDLKASIGLDDVAADVKDLKSSLTIDLKSAGAPATAAAAATVAPAVIDIPPAAARDGEAEAQPAGPPRPRFRKKAMEEPASPEPVTEEPAAEEPQPVNPPRPGFRKRAATEPIAPILAAECPAAAEPATNQPTTGEPVATELRMAEEPTMADRAAAEATEPQPVSPPRTRFGKMAAVASTREDG